MTELSWPDGLLRVPSFISEPHRLQTPGTTCCRLCCSCWSDAQCLLGTWLVEGRVSVASAALRLPPHGVCPGRQCGAFSCRCEASSCRTGQRGAEVYDHTLMPRLVPLPPARVRTQTAALARDLSLLLAVSSAPGAAGTVSRRCGYLNALCVHACLCRGLACPRASPSLPIPVP